MAGMTVKHFWKYCGHCKDRMVVCGQCGNNCCNGGYGEMPPGVECDSCPSAYAVQDAGETPISDGGKPAVWSYQGEVINHRKAKRLFRRP